MHTRPRNPALPLAAVVAALLLAALAPSVAAHAAFTAGDYSIEVGWQTEPAYVNQPNAVQFIIHDKGENPVTDIGPNDLAVVVSTAGTDSASMSFDPGWNVDEGEGPLGEYDAAIVPTAPGDYTFHITGTVHGTAIDISVTSGDETFDTVIGSGDLEFPAKLPALGEVATRLDRIDTRIAAIQSADPGAAALTAAQAASTAAQSALDAANRALLVGTLIGGAGVVLALASLYLANRARRGGAGPG